MGAFILVHISRGLSSGTALVGSAHEATPGIARLLLIRHGESEYNRDGRFQGSLRGVMRGPKLTRLGHQQARTVGDLIHARGDVDEYRALVSPLRRARQTWRHVKRRLGNPALGEEAWNELREIDFFEWEGRMKEDIRQEDAERWRMWVEEPWDLQLPSGAKPVQMVIERAAAVWMRLSREAKRGSTTVVTAHGALLRGVLLSALGLPPQAWRHPDLAYGNCAVAELELKVSEDDQQQPVLQRWRWFCGVPGGEGGECGPWLEVAAFKERVRNFHSDEGTSAEGEAA